MEIQPADDKDVIKIESSISSLSSSVSSLQDLLAMRLQTHFPAQPETPHSSNALPHPSLIARWEIEDGKLVCRWIIGDRPHNPTVRS